MDDDREALDVAIEQHPIEHVAYDQILGCDHLGSIGCRTHIEDHLGLHHQDGPVFLVPASNIEEALFQHLFTFFSHLHRQHLCLELVPLDDGVIGNLIVEPFSLQESESIILCRWHTAFVLTEDFKTVESFFLFFCPLVNRVDDKSLAAVL